VVVLTIFARWIMPKLISHYLDKKRNEHQSRLDTEREKDLAHLRSKLHIAAMEREIQSSTTTLILLTAIG